MKVAIVSNQPGQTGKSVLAILFGTLFATTQKKRVSIFSTGDMKDLYDMVNITSINSQTKSINVYKALMMSASIRGDEIIDYSDRIGDSEVYAFNLFSAKIDSTELEELFLTTLNKCNTELSLVEIQGDLKSEFNQKVLHNCDTIIYVVNPNRASVEQFHKFQEEMPRRVLLKTGYVCQHYNSNILSEKKLAKDMKVNIRDFKVLPESPAVTKAAYLGDLDKLVKSIKEGVPEVLPLRVKLLEIMQSIFDDGNVKYIKGVDQWFK